MKGDKEIYKKAKGFDKNPQNINRSGANRKLVSTVTKELNEKGIEQVTSAQIVGLYQSFLNLTEPELKKIVNGKDEPMLNRIIAKSMLDKKGFEIIEKMLDRAHGKAQNKIEHSGEIETKLTYDDFE
ncbi:MAG: hypothetical protein GY870_19295 [archaeon]|nr:hypothetical protein [archaeon]